MPASPPPPDFEQHLLWSVQKGNRTAHARYIVGPATLELRVLVDPDLVWSQVYQLTEVDALSAAANTHLAAFRHDGWVQNA